MATYTFGLAAKDFEFQDEDPRCFGLPVNFALKRDGVTVSVAYDALEYTCKAKDGGIMHYDSVRQDIRDGELEELYEVEFTLLDDEDIVDQLVHNMAEDCDLDKERIRELLDEFVDTLTDEYAEFASLFDGPDFWPPPKYTDMEALFREP